MIKLYKGDCLEVMKVIPDKSIDMILCDLPYGTQKNNGCKWDIMIPFDCLWEEYDRIITELGMEEVYKYSATYNYLLNI